MKHCLLLMLLILPIFCEIEINHGDPQNTRTRIYTDEGGLIVSISEDTDHGSYSIKNENTGVEVEYTESELHDRDALSYTLKLNKNGKDYNYDFSNGDKETRKEQGTYVKDAEGSESLEVQGSYSYLGSKGYYIQGYVADKNGFRTKVAFGPKIPFSITGLLSEALSPIIPGKGIDGALLCSLVGGGCKK